MTTWEIPQWNGPKGHEVEVDYAECEHGVMLSERTHGTLDCPLHPLGQATIRYVPKDGTPRYDRAW